ncbi:hypothetical protein [Mycobacterium sp. D16R24]|uniref:hypothetical protein n=1 Tax=Mycobacterium sp. D16R24 TaxID=1855656 RepID=UPI000991B00C|nr:hypothetical protein [Mycobacterium sp. D16R24]
MTTAGGSHLTSPTNILGVGVDPVDGVTVLAAPTARCATSAAHARPVGRLAVQRVAARAVVVAAPRRATYEGDSPGHRAAAGHRRLPFARPARFGVRLD